MPSSLATDHSSAFGFSPRPPVSVSGTGRRGLELRGFSREHASNGCPLGRGLAVLSRLGTAPGVFPPGLPFALQRPIPSGRASSASPSPRRIRAGRWNVHQLSIGIATRLSLRSRLTLIRLSLIRNPWSSGEEVSRLLYRYLCLHLPFRPLQRVSRRAFGGNAMLPYQHSLSRGFGNALIPVHHPCGTARPVSCYALFECMAASKPTS